MPKQRVRVGIVQIENLLVDPGLGGAAVLEDTLLAEPEGNLALSRLDRVRAVADVAADSEGVVTADLK